MKIREIEAYFQVLYPSERSCPWDNDGLLVCSDREREVEGVLTCLDVTFPAIEKAISEGCNLIVSHHPLIFSPLKRLNENDLVSQKIFMMVENGISLISLHTRFDGAVGGLNERFANKLGILPVSHPPLLEDEPFIGGLGILSGKISPEEFGEICSNVLEEPVKVYSAGLDIEKVGYCCGAGKDLVMPALRQGADAFIGGDISYHVALEAVENGMTVIDCGHYGSEKEAPFILENALISFQPDLNVVSFLDATGGEFVKKM